MRTGDVILIKNISKIGGITWKSKWNHIAVIIIKADFIYVLENVNGDILIHEYVKFCRLYKRCFVILRHLSSSNRMCENSGTSFDTIDYVLSSLEIAILDTYTFNTGSLIDYSAATVGYLYFKLNFLDPSIDWTSLKIKDFSPEYAAPLNIDARLDKGRVIN